MNQKRAKMLNAIAREADQNKIRIWQNLIKEMYSRGLWTRIVIALKIVFRYEGKVTIRQKVRILFVNAWERVKGLFNRKAKIVTKESL